MVSLLTGLGGGAGFGENFLGRNDDGSTARIDISSVFPNGLNFFGTTYQSLYINNNGNITFNQPRSQFTPNTITSITSNPEISVFLADIDTRGGVVAPSPGGTSQGTNLTWYDLDSANRTLTVTYDDVGYYSGHTNLLNAMQIVLTDRSGAAGRTAGDFDISFRYEEVNWTTGDASGGSGGLGGVIARAGYSAGFGQATSFFELPQSGQQQEILALEDLPGNAGVPGLWTFEVRNGAVPTTLSISATTPRVIELNAGQESTVFFNVVRSGDVTGQVSVPYTVMGSGTQPIGADDLPGGRTLPYSGVAVFEPGITNVQIEVPIRGDGLIEANEFVTVVLDAAPGAQLAYGQRQATATIVNDDGLPPGIPPDWRPAVTWGDPHLVSWDGLGFDFQAAGEFTLARSTAGADFVLQVRYEPYPGSSAVSIATAAATLVDGHRVTYDAGTDTLRIDGVPTAIDPTAGQVAVGGGAVYLLPDGGYRIVYPDGQQTVTLNDRGGFLDFDLAAAPSRAGQFTGLLGNFDGNTGNDLVMADGSVLPQPVAFSTLYGAFADSWRVGGGSLFDYEAGETTGSFDIPGFPATPVDLASLPPALVAAARAAAQANGITDPAVIDAAALDYLLTGDSGFLDSAAAQPTPSAHAVPQVDVPVAVLLGVAGPTTAVEERDAGSTEVTFTLYRTSGAGSLTVDYAVEGITANAADFAGGVLPTGSITFEDGQTSRQFSIAVQGDTIPEFDETFLLKISSADPSVQVIARQAQVTIATDDGEPPVTPPTPGDAPTEGPDVLWYGNAATGVTVDALGGNDSIHGSEFADTLNGGAGDDLMKGAGGDDTLIGGEGIDTVFFDFALVDASFEVLQNGYAITGTQGRDVLIGIERFVFTDGTVVLDDGAPLVDDLFYYMRNKDVWQAGLEAEQHYQSSGAAEGRDPNAWFSTVAYNAANPDVVAAGMNPLEHYASSGWAEGRITGANFDSAAYLQAHPDVTGNPLEHFLTYGQSNGYAAIPVSSLVIAGVDWSFYYAHNPDVAQSGLNPSAHYASSGWSEGRDPNAFFDTEGYLAAYASAVGAANPLEHYIAQGAALGFDPSADFDTSAYLAAYPDVAASGMNPLLHFLQSGQAEGRATFADGVFDV